MYEELKEIMGQLADLREKHRAKLLENIYETLEKYCRYCGYDTSRRDMCSCQDDS